ncbi:MAG: hypothetical protein JO205_00415 [Pseudolabrys sp.]|nr:hypothetical protein [Pseudolabrys sp.]
MRGLGTANFGDVVSLEACVERAGAAMACAFSSSDEYESALIAERRAAGVYGPKRRRQIVMSVAGVVCGEMLLVWLAI